MTVDTTRQARCCSAVVNRPDDDRDERRRERTGGDELEDQVRDAERGEERVELGRSERAGDDDDADVAEDPRDEERAGDDQPGAGDRPGRAHGAGGAARPRVGLPIGGLEPTWRHVGVDLGRRQVLVTEQLLDDPQVRTAVEQMRRERVAEGVRRDADRQARPGAQPIEAVPQAAHAERRAEVVQEDLDRWRVVVRCDARAGPGGRPRGTPRAPLAPAGRAARSVPCAPCRAPGSRPAAGRARRARPTPAR